MFAAFRCCKVVQIPVIPYPIVKVVWVNGAGLKVGVIAAVMTLVESSAFTQRACSFSVVINQFRSSGIFQTSRGVVLFEMSSAFTASIEIWRTQGFGQDCYKALLESLTVMGLEIDVSKAEIEYDLKSCTVRSKRVVEKYRRIQMPIRFSPVPIKTGQTTL